MSSTTIKVSKSHPAVKAILSACFPQYKGRKIKLVLSAELATYACSDWDGGSRTVARFYNLRTGGVVYAMGGAGQSCPEGWAIVEHSVFCGQDAGITIRTRRAMCEADEQVAVDAILSGRTHDARSIVSRGLAIVEGSWGCYDRGHERVSALDVAWLAVWTIATDIEKTAAKHAAKAAA